MSISQESFNGAFKARGRLIDFDYSKKTDVTVPSLLGLSETLPPPSDEAQKDQDSLLQLHYRGQGVPPGVGRLVHLYTGSFFLYKRAMSKLSPLSATMVSPASANNFCSFNSHIRLHTRLNPCALGSYLRYCIVLIDIGKLSEHHRDLGLLCSGFSHCEKAFAGANCALFQSYVLRLFF